MIFDVACNKEMLLDGQKSILVCTKCGSCEHYTVYVTLYNRLMKPLWRKCIYKRSDNFKAILNLFFNGGKQLVPDNVMKAIRNETNNKTNILHNFEIPLTIPILECILKRNKMTKYENGIYYIFFKINGQPFRYVTAREYNIMLNAFNVVSSIYDKYKPKGRKSFLNYYFVLNKLLIMLGKIEYAKYMPQLKTHSKQKELERVWDLITEDPEWVVALRKQKII